MKIEKYRYLTDGRYKVVIDGKEYILFEDVILKHKLLSAKEIEYDTLMEYLQDNESYEAYYLAVKYIKNRLRTSKEIRSYLDKKGYNKTIIDKIVLKLENEKYLDEGLYCSSYIHDQVYLKECGPIKIRKDLEKLGVSDKTIDENMRMFTKEIQESKIMKYINKEVKINKNKSEKMLKAKILERLVNNGFYRDDILKCLNSVSIDEKDIYKREYDKIYNKLSKKYAGKELEYMIKQKLFQKGFVSK